MHLRIIVLRTLPGRVFACRGGKPKKQGVHVLRESTNYSSGCPFTWGRVCVPTALRFPTAPPPRRYLILGQVIVVLAKEWQIGYRADLSARFVTTS